MNRISLNIPNLLTILRLAMVPAVAILIYYDLILAALIIFLAACVTDLLDGFIARKCNMITEEGVLLDPLADKLMSIGAVIAFTVIRDAQGMRVVPVAILIVIMVKEAMMIGGGILLYYKNIVAPANMFGKIAAFTFNTAVAFAFLYKLVAPWHIYFLWFALALMIAALLQYAYFNMYKQLKKQPQQGKAEAAQTEEAENAEEAESQSEQSAQTEEAKS